MSELSFAQAGQAAARRRADRHRIRELTEALERAAARAHRSDGEHDRTTWRECQHGDCVELRTLLVVNAI